MKCKSCGKEIVVDEQTKVGVCSGCGKKFVLSTVARAKVCSECKTELVDKGAFWECPKCGKRFSFVKKKQNESSNVVVTTKLTTESETNGKTTIVETRKESSLKKSSFDEAVDIDIGEYRVSLKTTPEQMKNAPSDDVIMPTKNDENDYIIPAKMPEDDVIIPTKDVKNDVHEDDLIDDVDLGVAQTKKDNLPKKQTPSTKKETSSQSLESSKGSVPTKNENSNRISPQKVETKVQNKQNPTKETTLQEPKLLDNNTTTSKVDENPIMPPIAKSTKASRSSSPGMTVLCKVGGIILGILIVLVGIACFVTSHFDLFKNLVDVKIDNILQTLQTVCTYVFFGLFALMLLLATLKDIRFKRIGTIFTLIAPILLIVTVALESELTKAKILADFIYAGYAILVFGCFLTMVITSKTDLSSSATIMGLVLFIFSILSLLVVSLQLLPLESLKLDALKPVLPYLQDADKVLLGFANISTAVLIAKSE